MVAFGAANLDLTLDIISMVLAETGPALGITVLPDTEAGSETSPSVLTLVGLPGFFLARAIVSSSSLVSSVCLSSQSVTLSTTLAAGIEAGSAVFYLLAFLFSPLFVGFTTALAFAVALGFAASISFFRRGLDFLLAGVCAALGCCKHNV